MLTEAQRYAIRGLTKRAVEAAGGYEACATVSRVKRGATFGDYINDPRYMVPFDVAIDIDRYALATGKRPLFGDHYAELIGHLLVAPPDGTPEGQLTQHSSQSAEWFGKMISDIFLALGDGKLTEDERVKILADARHLMVELAALIEAVRMVPSAGEGR